MNKRLRELDVVEKQVAKEAMIFKKLNHKKSCSELIDSQLPAKREDESRN